MERLHCGHLRCPCLLQVYQSKWFFMIWSIVSERNKYDFFITGKSGTSQVTSSSSNSTTSPPTGPNGPMTTNSGASVKENRYRHLLWKKFVKLCLHSTYAMQNSFRFNEIFAQFFNQAEFYLDKKSMKNSWNFVYIQATQCRTPFVLTKFFKVNLKFQFGLKW